MKKLWLFLSLFLLPLVLLSDQTMDSTKWTFDASAQTVTIDNVSNLAHVTKIVNRTDQVVIYAPEDPDRGGSVSGNVVTLNFDTTTMSDSDNLWITYEVTNIALGETAFGELSTAEVFPEVQLQFSYNVNPLLAKTRLNGGSATVSNSLVSLSTGTSANQSAQLLSVRPVKYNTGQGTVNRFTAIYTTGVANSTQWVGIGTIGDGFFFGYNGIDFSILRRFGGGPEIRTLTVTAKSTTAENVTITLNSNSTGDTVAVTDATATDATTTANEIAAHDYSAVGRGWSAHAMGDTVVFESWGDTARGGTYSLSSATTATATVAQTLVGVAVDDTNVVAQASWSEGSLPFTLDPTNGNVYQIRYEWLGFGMIAFYVENPSSGDWHLVHVIEYANANTAVSLRNPSLPLMAIAENTSNTTDIIIQTSSMSGFTEGQVFNHTPALSVAASKATIGTAETPVLTLHNHTIFQSVLNRVESDLLSLSISVDGTKPAIIRIRENPTLTAASFSAVDASRSVLQKDTTATVVSGGLLTEFTLSKEASVILSDVFNVRHLQVSDTVTVSVEATSGTTDARVTITYRDLF